MYKKFIFIVFLFLTSNLLSHEISSNRCLVITDEYIIGGINTDIPLKFKKHLDSELKRTNEGKIR